MYVNNESWVIPLILTAWSRVTMWIYGFRNSLQFWKLTFTPTRISYFNLKLKRKNLINQNLLAIVINISKLHDGIFKIITIASFSYEIWHYDTIVFRFVQLFHIPKKWHQLNIKNTVSYFLTTFNKVNKFFLISIVISD